MPQPFREVKYHTDVLKYFGGNPPTSADAKCIRQLLADVCAGKELIRPFPDDPMMYLPKIACNHEIYFSEDAQNRLFVHDIYYLPQS